MALGEPARGVAGFRASHEQAVHARRVARLEGRPAWGITRYGEVALQATVSTDIEQARAFAAHKLGRLFSDDEKSRRLAATLEVYLGEQCSRIRAARRLGIHENTVSYRIRQAEEILGHSVQDDTLGLRVALAIAPMLAPGNSDGRGPAETS
jgi:DNA-binding PucR family transcriptional regulator